MSGHRLFFLFASFFSSALTLSAGVGINPGSIQFPDGSFQDTAALPQLPPNSAWVATSGGDYVSPIDAMNDLSVWCGGGRCTLLIAPGIYELPMGEQLLMHQQVDIVGMGMESTKLLGRVGSGVPGESSALVLGAAGSTLRDVSVFNQGVDTAAFAVGVYNKHRSFNVTRVKVTAGAADNNAGRYALINEGVNAVDVSFKDIIVFAQKGSVGSPQNCFGIWNKGKGQLDVSYARILVAGCEEDNTAIQNNDGNLRLSYVSAEAYFSGAFRAYAVWSALGTITILNSTLKSSYRSLGIGSESDRVINTQLNGTVVDSFPSPSTQCRGTYDGNLVSVSC